MQESLKVGDNLPLFVAKDQNGDEFRIESLIGKKVLVIYFYPKDDTPGCTKQACFLRDHYEEFKEIGAEVIGISADGAASHRKFIHKYDLPFILLSDADKKLRKIFGVKNNFLGLIPGRVTYIVDLNGVVQMVFEDSNAENHLELTVEKVKSLM
ncbi:peroxiredoxin [Flavobacterium amniphilum]|uniref:peroxiredoxin n=1 Tax=Flavobacterium amniphilum TaxID=1834035 RepID=UPI00202A9DC8|nr:peroxiredoxin [Flavobacterium amniphilum]MCL9806187.1 peroxiredoxin [Flavobacterium amniphilum]